MITFKGKSYNIEKQVICKVTYDINIDCSIKDSFLCTKMIYENIDNFEGIIIDSENIPNCKSQLKLYMLKNAFKVLEENDVLLIKQDGQAILLYRDNWFSNTLFLTERCNSRCIMCPQPPRPDSDSYIDIALQSLDLMQPDTINIGITGGEPTIIFDKLIDVITKCRKKLPHADIQLLTNARNLKDYGKVKALANCCDNKLYVGVPLYSDIDNIHDEICGVNGAFYETIEGLYNLKRLNIPIELRTVVISQNYIRLKEWVDFIYKNISFVSTLAIMALEPMGLAAENIDKIWIDPIDYSDQLNAAIKQSTRYNMQILLFNHQLCTISPQNWHLSMKSISEWKNIYFEACNLCDERIKCGGFFESSSLKKSRGIYPIRHSI